MKIIQYWFRILLLLYYGPTLTCAYLEEHELFLDGSEDLVSLDLEDVESDGLGEGSALSDGDNITFVDSLESGGAVSGDVGVSLLVSAVLFDIVEVISSDDDGSVHFGADAHALKNTTSDGDVSGEGALLVDVSGLDGVSGGVEAKSDFFEVSHGVHFFGQFSGGHVVSFDGNLLFGLLNSVQEVLVVGVDSVLLLESFVSLNISHFNMKKIIDT